MRKSRRTNSQQQIVVDAFDKRAQTYCERYSRDSTEAHSFNIRRQRVYELLDSYNRGKVLDIGCGPGIMVDHLINKGFEFFGVDISREMINECKRKFGHIKSAHFSVGNIEKLQFSDSYFDVVVNMGVVEYLDDDKPAVEEMARVLKPGGIVIITLPNKLSPYRVWDRILLFRSTKNLVRRIIQRKRQVVTNREYTEVAYCNLLASYRLKVTDIVYYNFNLLFFPLDRLLPGLAVLISRKLEFLCQSKFRWLGTGFIVKAEKGQTCL